MAHFNIDPTAFTLNESCTYFDMDNLNTISDASNSLNLIHVNFRLCNKNLDKFLCMLDSMPLPFPIVVLTETWLNSEEDWVNVPGYVAYHSIRKDRRGGGVTVLVHSSISSSLYQQYTSANEYFESLSVQFLHSAMRYTVLGYILGDFNVDYIASSPSIADQSFFDEMKSQSLILLINIPTSVCPSLATCIDNIFTNHIGCY